MYLPRSERLMRVTMSSNRTLPRRIIDVGRPGPRDPAVVLRSAPYHYSQLLKVCDFGQILD
jgi:hypothetical protein